MAKYDVFRDPRGTDNLLVVIQDDMFDALETRLAVPLLPVNPKRRPLKKLNPVFSIEGADYALYTQHMLAVPKPALKEQVTNIRGVRDEITAAVDFLMLGF
ncbi:MAG: CcdB family protein [Rhizobiaceae bacterium]|nr:CcdB family protein [Rhizobiaceae bacterium]